MCKTQQNTDKNSEVSALYLTCRFTHFQFSSVFRVKVRVDFLTLTLTNPHEKSRLHTQDQS